MCKCDWNYHCVSLLQEKGRATVGAPFSSIRNGIAQGTNPHFSETILLMSSLDIKAPVFLCLEKKIIIKKEETSPHLFPLFNFDKTIA